MKKINNKNNPDFLNDYLMHLKVVKMLSERTIEEYYLDIRLFLKFYRGNQLDIDGDVEDIDISAMTVDDMRKITVTDIYNFIFYTADERKNAEKARYRKLSALRSFFKYLTKTTHFLKEDPTKDIEVPSPKKSLPKHLSLDESVKLLANSNDSDSVRDYCILTLFLNCGMRLSELVSINLNDMLYGADEDIYYDYEGHLLSNQK